VPSGAQAKLLVQAGLVKVNGEVETRRGRGSKRPRRLGVP
jgi:ribosome-associated protein YbcJ (S4-like RNA binding protein)